MIVFTVPGQPVGKGRPRVGRRGQFVQMFTPERTASYENLVAFTAKHAMGGRALFTEAVAVNLHITLSIPSSWSKRKQQAAERNEIMPTVKPDIDNVEKAIFDAMNGIVWKDDVQVVDVRKRKRYGLTPGVRVEIWSAADPLREPP